MEELDAQRQALSDTLDYVEFGIVVLDAEGRVVVANRVAQEVARQRDGLLLSTSGLATSNPAETERLHSLIAAATRQRLSSGGTMVVSRPSGRKALSILTCPLAGHEMDSGSHRAVTAIFITDPERRIDGLQERLACLYGLTQREAMLASLLTQGQDLREASEHLGVSLSTVQSHLKHILEKTGTHRQAECVALFLSSLAPVSSPQESNHSPCTRRLARGSALSPDVKRTP
jgi:DNA-binding CsgD family transcriptional regulator